jgi:ADP-ribosylglycohydrolase
MTLVHCLTTQAYADALGKFTEFLTEEQVRELYPNGLDMQNGQSNGHNDCWDRYEWTDDTDQTLLVLQTCLASKSLPDPKHDLYLRDFAKRILYWYRNGFPKYQKKGCGIGNQVRWVVNMADYEKDPAQCSKLIWEDSEREIRSNGALMRTGVIGIVFTDYGKITDVATQITMATHYDPYCVAVSVFQSLLMRLLIDRVHNNIENVIRDCLRVTESTLPSIIMDTSKISLIKYLDDLIRPVLDGSYHPRHAHLDDPYHRGSIGCSLTVALWGLLQVKLCSYLTIIQSIASYGGDADTNCAICGILLGACISRAQLPSDYRLMNIKMITDIIHGHGHGLRL